MRRTREDGSPSRDDDFPVGREEEEVAGNAPGGAAFLPFEGVLLAINLSGVALVARWDEGALWAVCKRNRVVRSLTDLFTAPTQRTPPPRSRYSGCPTQSQYGHGTRTRKDTTLSKLCTWCTITTRVMDKTKLAGGLARATACRRIVSQDTRERGRMWLYLSSPCR